MPSHFEYMSLALQLAARGRFTVSPNPMVGCVIVKNDQIIGQGYHQRAGEAHAEVLALAEAGARSKDAIAYVTLEPCCHFGRTPPCVAALIHAEIKEVYVACLDPNPLVAGKGVATLRAAGIVVHIGLCEEEAKKLNEIFFHYITHKRPFVIAKWAMSLDGKTITAAGDSKKISNEISHQHTHELRATVDAILVGANTARLDNPQLNVRDVSENIKQPLRVVLMGSNELPFDLQLFQENPLQKTLLVTTKKINFSFSNNIEVLVLDNETHQINLKDILDELGRRSITSLLVEGGQTMHQSFLRENLINKVCVYVAPVLIGDLPNKKIIPNFQVTSLGADLFLEGSVNV